MELEAKNYRILLREKLEERCSRNSRYSLRSFARDLDISPSRLSDVLRGRYGLSRLSAEKIGQKLGFNKGEIVHFCDLVDSEHARAQKNRVAARTRLESSVPAQQQLTMDAFQIVSDWYHFAILELTAVKDFKLKYSTKWVGARLNISEHIVIAAIERMKRLELIEEINGVPRPTENFTASPDGIPSEAIKKFHLQILEKATAALRVQTVDERDFSSIIMAINPKDLPQAKEEIKIFRRHLNKRFEKSKTKTSIYCLNVQLFRISEDKL